MSSTMTMTTTMSADLADALLDVELTDDVQVLDIAEIGDVTALLTERMDATPGCCSSSSSSCCTCSCC
jgi:hypothetical protein